MDPKKFKNKYTCAKCGALAVNGLCSDCAGDNEPVYDRKGSLMAVGFHLGGGYGLLSSAMLAESLNLPCYQSFLNTPRRYWPTEYSSQDAREFKAVNGNRKVFFHAPYMINMVANPDTDERSRRMSLHSLKKQFLMAAKMGAIGLITHVGSSKGQEQEATDSLLYEFLSELITDPEVVQAYSCMGTKLLLENDAGAGTQVFNDLWYITQVLEHMNCEILGWCLDTAHDYAAGNDYEDERIPMFLHEQFEASMSGMDDQRVHQLRIPDLIHFNNPDPNVQCGSHLDRHASVLDEGRLPLETMHRMYDTFRDFSIPMVIEGSPDPEHDLRIALQWELEFVAKYDVTPTLPKEPALLIITE